MSFEFTVKDLGPSIYFFSIAVIRDSSGLFLSQFSIPLRFFLGLVCHDVNLIQLWLTPNPNLVLYLIII